MDAQGGQDYLSLGPQNNDSVSLRKALNGRSLALCACVALVTVGALLMSSTSDSNLQSTNDIVNLFAPQSTRGVISSPLQAKIMMTGPANKWKDLALATIEATNRCNPPGVRDVAMQAAISKLDTSSKAKLKNLVEKTVVRAEGLNAEDLPGVTAPLGFFDPVGFSTDIPEGKLLFYREVELKHGRLCMLASLGILVSEKFHPLFGGNIDGPAAFAFQQTPLQQFWVGVLGALFAAETASIESFQPLAEGGKPWQMRTDRVPGDFGYDPLGIKPSDPEELKDLQTKELNNGRLAMFATAGMIAQELVTGKTLF